MKSVFVSSTFKDMQAERDLLHERVFPRLRNVIREYGEDIQELDLRWGIDTINMSEEESGHKVLQICIDAIDRCRPYIVVLLGERYGWIPDTELVDSLRDKRISAHYTDSMSVTNLEIQYGALSSEQAVERCVFCFRDPSVIARIDDGHRQLYASESGVHKTRLDRLKRQIRALPGANILDYEAEWDADRSCVTGLDAFGEQLYARLEALIRADFQGQSVKHPQLRREQDMRLIQEGYLNTYVVRTAEEYRCLRIIHQYLRGKNNRRIYLSGDAGSGKSAMMAALAKTLEGMGYPVILYFSDAVDSQSPQALKTFLIWQLEKIYHTPHKEDIPSVDDRLRVLAKELKRLGGQKVFCLIDALDQLYEREREIYLDFLDLCPDMFFVLSALPSFPMERAGRNYHYGFETVTMEPLSHMQREQLIAATAARRGKQLDGEILGETVSRPGAVNPLYLSMVLQRFFMMGQQEFEAAEALAPGMEGLHRYMAALLNEMPEQPEEMASCLLRAAGERFGEDQYRQILALLAMSRSGLSERELAGMMALGGRRFLPLNFQQMVSYLYDAFSMREDGKWTFRHRLFQEAVEAQCPGECAEARRLLAAFSAKDPQFMRAEGFYYLLAYRDDAAGAVLSQASEWENCLEVAGEVGRLAELDPEYRDFFTRLTRQDPSDGMAAFWDAFLAGYYSGDVLRMTGTLRRLLLDRDDIDVKYRWHLARDLATIRQNCAPYASSYQEAERYLAQAEELCRLQPSPEKEMGCAEIYDERAWMAGRSGVGWDKVNGYYEQAKAFLKPVQRPRDDPAEWPFHRCVLYIKARHAEAAEIMDRAETMALWKECLEELDRLKFFDGTEEYLKYTRGAMTGLFKAFQMKMFFDAEQSEKFGLAAVGLAEKLADKWPTLHNLEVRHYTLKTFATHFPENERYPLLERAMNCARKGYGSCRTDFWKNLLARSETEYAYAATKAVLERRKPPRGWGFRGDVDSIWDHGLQLFEELTAAGYPGVSKDFCMTNLYRRAESARAMGYLVRAEGYIRRSLELLDHGLRTDAEFQKWYRSWIARGQLLYAQILNDLMRPEEAVQQAEAAVETSLLAIDASPARRNTLADGGLLAARSLYRCRRDDEALAACGRSEALLARLRPNEEEQAARIRGELDYIRARLALERKDLDAAQAHFRRCESYYGGETEREGYGQYLILKADLLTALHMEGTPEAWDKAYSYWEKTRWREQGQFYRNDAFQADEKEREYRRESYHFALAAYYEAYCCFRGFEHSSNYHRTMCRENENLYSYIDRPYLHSICPPELQDNWRKRLLRSHQERLQQWNARSAELTASFPSAERDAGGFVELMARYTGTEEDWLDLSAFQVLDLVGRCRPRFEQWHPTAAQSEQLYQIAAALVKFGEHAESAIKNGQDSNARIAARLHLTPEQVQAMPVCHENKVWNPKGAWEKQVFYRAASQLNILASRSCEPLPEKLARKIDQHAALYCMLMDSRELVHFTDSELDYVLGLTRGNKELTLACYLRSRDEGYIRRLYENLDPVSPGPGAQKAELDEKEYLWRVSHIVDFCCYMTEQTREGRWLLMGLEWLYERPGFWSRLSDRDADKFEKALSALGAESLAPSGRERLARARLNVYGQLREKTLSDLQKRSPKKQE